FQYHACAAIGGGVNCAGYNGYGELGNNSTTNSPMPVAVTGLFGVTSVAVGGFHSCALSADGTVRCWGYNYAGQLGDGTTTQRLTPVLVSGLNDATQIAAGYGFTCARRKTGAVV